MRNVQSPYAEGNHGTLSEDGKSALVTFDDPGRRRRGQGRARRSPRSSKLDKQETGFRIEEFGDASADKALSQAFEDDFQKAEVTSLPITLIILILAFGALLAAFVPLLLAITAVAAAIGLIGPISQIWPVDEAISSVVLLIGLAVGVDYSMFYLRREREERAARALGGGRPRSGGRHLRPCGARLRHHGDRGDGRHVLRRRRDVHLVRHRHDPGGRDRGDRLADRAAGRPVEARRPGEQGPRAVPASPSGARASRASGRGCSTACSSARWSRRSPRAACSWCSRSRCSTSTPPTPAWTGCRARSTSCRPTTGCRRRSRASSSPPTSWSQGDNLDQGQIQAAAQQLRQIARESDQFNEPVTVDTSPDGKVAVIEVPLAGSGSDDTSLDAVEDAARRRRARGAAPASTAASWWACPASPPARSTSTS